MKTDERNVMLELERKAPAPALVTLMLARIVCPNCGHIGAATAASLPRVLICSQCGHGAFIKSGRPARSPSVARDEQAALRDRPLSKWGNDCRYQNAHFC